MHCGAFVTWFQHINYVQPIAFDHGKAPVFSTVGAFYTSWFWR